MVVLATTDPFGGAFTYAAQLAAAAFDRGVHTVLAVLGGRLSRAQRRELDPSVDVREGPFRLEWMDDPWEDVGRSMEWLATLAAETRPDVLHLNTFAHAALDVGIPRLLVAHSCVCSWWRAVHGQEAPAGYDRYRAVVRSGLDGADVVVAPTAAFAEELVHEHGPIRELRVVANGTAVRSADGPRDPVVLAAGRLWDEAKNLLLLDQVAARLPWPILVAGEGRGPDGGEIVPQRVQGLGRLDHGRLLVTMARASVFCHPARYEPFGLAPLEAARRGCALVLSDLPSLREVWGDAALYAHPDDAFGFAEAIDALLRDPVRRGGLAAAARARAETFTADAHAERTCALYRALAGGPR